MAKKPERFDFEKALNELETLVKDMEQGDMDLETSLKAFERGVALTRDCQKALGEAEARVRILTQKDGEPGLEPYDETGDPD